MSAVRQRLCTHTKTASYTSSCPWWRIVAALLTGMFVLGDACQVGKQFLNSTSGSCQECTDCEQLELIPVEPCNATSDSVCEPCPNPNEYYAVAFKRCTLDCARVCPNGRCVPGNEGQCECSSRCLGGVLCEIRMPECDSPTIPTTQPRNVTSPTTRAPTQQVVLPHWGIALVSIGVILGIVLFSALFVLLGLFTSRHRGHHDDFSSSSSSNMKCGSLAERLSYSNGATSSSLISLYTQSNSPSFQNYQLSLKQGSSPSNFDSWNNIKCSPKTQRSSSATMSKSRDGFLTPV